MESILWIYLFGVRVQMPEEVENLLKNV